MTLPSKELLSAVLGKDVKMVIADIEVIHNQLNSSVKNSEIAIMYDDTWAYENIYELMHSMKKWAYEKHRQMIYSTSEDENSAQAYFTSVFDLSEKENKYFCEPTELEAVTKACECILIEKLNT